MSENEELCLTNEELCITNEELCIKNEEILQHTDQSYRSPPPDGSALYCVTPAAGDQGDTFFADCAAAYDALPLAEQAELAQHQLIHATFELGRSQEAVRAHPGNKALFTKHFKTRRGIHSKQNKHSGRTHGVLGTDTSRLLFSKSVWYEPEHATVFGEGVGAAPEVMEREAEGMLPQLHPLVREHPVTGRQVHRESIIFKYKIHHFN